MTTPTTVNTWPLNGSVQEFDVTFDYLSQTFIKVSLIGPTGLAPLVLGTDYTFVTPTRIRTTLSYGPPTYTTIELRRETSTTERLVEFQDASILHATDLNTDSLQVMHVAEEARNSATETLGVNGDGNLDARNRRIVNVIDPVDPADALTLNYYTSQVSGVYQDRIAAEAARDKAKDWATRPAQVETGLESAKTYAAQADTSRASAATQASNAATSASQALTYRGDALNAASAAGISAGQASTSASAAAGSASAASGSASAASTSASNAAAQVPLAAAQVALATTQAGLSKTEADRSKTEADRAASYVDPANPNWLTPNVESLNGGFLSGFRNLLINGNMLVNQRGYTSTVIPAGGVPVFTADRWKASKNGTQTVMFEHGPSFLVGNRPRDCIQVRATSSYTNLPGDYVLIEQRVEGNESTRLRGQTFTLSFLVFATRPGQYTVAFRNGPGGRSYLAPFNVTASLAWQKITVTVVGGIPIGDADGLGGTQWNVGAGVGLQLSFIANGGSTYVSSTVNAWQSNSVAVAAGQVQGLQASGDVFAITEVQLELGPKATPFERRNVAAEITLCQRYFELTSVVTAMTANGANSLSFGWSPFATAKRVEPTITVRSVELSNGVATANLTPFRNWGCYVDVRSAVATGDCYYFAVVEADAEL